MNGSLIFEPATREGDVSTKGGAGIAYLLLHPESVALAERSEHAIKDSIQRIYADTDVRLTEARSIAAIVRNAREMRDEILAAAAKSNVPVGELGYALSQYQRSGSETVVTSGTNHETKQQKNALAVTVKKMTLASLTQLRQLYKNGTDTLVIAERGAAPYGTILERIIEELELPEMRMEYFKFQRPEKLAESYAKTSEGMATFTEEEQALLDLGSILRADEKQRRKEAAGSEGHLATKGALEQHLLANKELYNRAAAEGFRHQLAAAERRIGSLNGRIVKVYDDLKKSGATSEGNIVPLLNELGARITDKDVVALLDSKTNNGPSMIRSSESLDDNYDVVTRWMDQLPWRQLSEASGVSYGIDENVRDANALFTRGRDLRQYSLDAPKEHYYSQDEKQAIVAEFLQKTFLLEQDREVHIADVAAQAYRILDDHNVLEKSLEGTQQRLNSLRVRTMRNVFASTVKDVIQKLDETYGREEVRNYIAGKEVAPELTKMIERQSYELLYGREAA